MEHVGENRVVGLRLDDPLLVIIVRERFRRGKESRADDDPLCAETQRLDEIAAIDHAARREEGHCADRNKLGEKRAQRDRAANMSARCDALRDQ